MKDCSSLTPEDFQIVESINYLTGEHVLCRVTAVKTGYTTMVNSLGEVYQQPRITLFIKTE